MSSSLLTGRALKKARFFYGKTICDMGVKISLSMKFHLLYENILKGNYIIIKNYISR